MRPISLKDDGDSKDVWAVTFWLIVIFIIVSFVLNKCSSNSKDVSPPKQIQNVEATSKPQTSKVSKVINFFHKKGTHQNE